MNAQPPGFWRRAGAAAVDVMVVTVAVFVVTAILGSALGREPVSAPRNLPPGRAAVIALSFAVLLGGPPLYAFIGWRRGQTLGMRALDLRVTGLDGAPLTTGQVLLRLGTSFWSLLLLALGFIAIALDPDKRGWHDHASGSRVVWSARPPEPYFGAPWGYPAIPPYPTGQYGYPPAPAGLQPEPATAPPPAASTPAAGPGSSPMARAWRSPATWGRSPWTWSDVIPVMVLFIPLLEWTGTLLGWLRHRVQPAAPSGVLRGVELIGLELLAYSGVFLLLFLLVGIRRHATLRDLGLGPVPWRWMFMAVPAVVVSYALETVTGLVGNSLFPGTPNTQCRDLREAFAGYLPTAIVVVAIIAPIVEETFFRGFLLRWLRDRLPWWVALVVSAAIFSASHFSYHQPTLFLPIFGAGLVLGVLYLHSGSIWPGVAAHGFFNLIPTLVLFLGSQTCA